MGHASVRYVYFAAHPQHLIPVREFKGNPRLEARKRQCFCPLCHQQLDTLVLDHQTPHGRHFSTSDCPYREGGEAAKHLNTKLHIRDLMNHHPEGPLKISTWCGGWTDRGVRHSCYERDGKAAFVTFPWLPNWDNVVDEQRLTVVAQYGKYRVPDLQVLRGGKPIAVIEIHNTHAVSPQKAAQLDALGMPWIEVRATEEPERKWRSHRAPLFAHRVHGVPTPRCAACEKKQGIADVIAALYGQKRAHDQQVAHQKALIEAAKHELAQIASLRRGLQRAAESAFQGNVLHRLMQADDPSQIVSDPQQFGRLRREGWWFPTRAARERLPDVRDALIRWQKGVADWQRTDGAGRMQRAKEALATAEQRQAEKNRAIAVEQGKLSRW